MTIEEARDVVLNGEQYKFLKKEPVILLSLGGSFAYGTNTATSDVDIRGIKFEPREAIIGLSSFEQSEVHDKEKDIDCVLYGLRKMSNLLLSNNPNCIEILSPQERNILQISPVGQMLIANRKVFLSQRAAFTFGAYAKAQLDRVENALCHDAYSQVKQEEHLKHSIETMIHHFNEKFTHFDDNSFVLRLVDAVNKEYEKEIVVDVNLKGYPIRDYKSIWSELQNVVKDYSKLNGRNRKKDAEHLNKHLMHLVRLYLMGIDILEKEEIITYRAENIDLLMDIRNGKYLSSSGEISAEFYDMVSDLKNKLDYAKKNTSLPVEPRKKEVEEMIMSIYFDYLYN